MILQPPDPPEDTRTTGEVIDDLKNQNDLLRGEVATLRYALVWVFEVFKINPEQWPDTYEVVNDAVNHTQTTAEQFIAECEQRGAVKALEYAAKEMQHRRFELPSEATDELLEMVGRINATSKKAG